MKIYFFLFSFWICVVTKAQDSAECYNSGVSLTERATSSFEEQPLPVTTQYSLVLMPNVMKEQEVILIMKEKNNSELNRLLKKVSLAKTFQNIGFAAIPEALIGGGLIGVAEASNTGGLEQKSAGVSLVVLSGICLTSSLCFKFVRTKNYKKAIQKYNQLYN